MRPIPLGRLALLATTATTAACGPDPLYGDWDATFLSISGYDPVALPIVGDLRDTSLGPMTYDLGLRFDIAEGGTGVMAFDYTYTYYPSGEVFLEGTDSYVFTTTRRARGVHVIAVPGYDDLLLECTATRADMACLGDDAVGAFYEMDFDRREE